MRVPIFILAAVGFATTACHKPPGFSPAAMPEESKGPAPMGSATSNALLKEKVELLGLMMAGQIPAEQLQKASERAKAIAQQPTQALDAEAQKALLVHDLYRRLPAGTSEQNPLTDAEQKQLIVAKLYFDERRFIEAAHRLSTLLDKKPKYPNARNLLARCFFFLGNQDRTVAELEFVLNTDGLPKGEKLDALFLMGAAVLESQTPSKKILARGIQAWETYLHEAPDSPQRPAVEKGLAAMRGTLSAPQGSPLSTRLAQLGAKASQADRQKAKALDAFDGQDAKTALPLLQQALKQGQADAELLTALGRTLVRLQEVERAKETFALAVQLFPEHVQAWHYRGMALLLGGDPAGAAESWRAVVAKDPAYAQTHQLARRIQVAENMATGAVSP